MKKAYNYWEIGIQYLHIAESVAEEVIESGNKFVLTSDEDISIEEYEKKTKWADHNLAIPLLFNFYHGLEVLLKGFLAASNSLNDNQHHKLTELLDKFEDKFDNDELPALLKKYLLVEKLNEPLKSFCKESSITIDNFYQALKYPESIKGKPYLHDELMFQGANGIWFYKELVRDIKKIRVVAVRIGNKHVFL